jgi:hypothetical protein
MGGCALLQVMKLRNNLQKKMQKSPDLKRAPIVSYAHLQWAQKGSARRFNKYLKQEGRTRQFTLPS